MRALLRSLLFCLTALHAADAAGVHAGASYEDVIAALGQPDWELDAGSRKNPHLRQSTNQIAGWQGGGFPTVVVLEANGKKYKTGGYVRGGPSAFIRAFR